MKIMEHTGKPQGYSKILNLAVDVINTQRSEEARTVYQFTFDVITGSLNSSVACGNI